MNNGYTFWAPLDGDRPGRVHKIACTAQMYDEAKSNGAAFISPMFFFDDPDSGYDVPNSCGSFVLNFNDQINPASAHKDALSFALAMAENYDVNPYHLQYFITGLKGFHVVIPCVLYKSECHPLMPLVYEEMAKRFACTYRTIDLNIYSRAPGGLVRIENIRRPNGQYKVPISFDELALLSYDELLKLSLAPRECVHDLHEPSHCPFFYGFYRRCWKDVYYSQPSPFRYDEEP